ncbi:MAG: hypothetical protein ABIF22_00885 [bacterium]
MKTQKGFIQIPILVAIIAGILIVSGTGYIGIKKYGNYQEEKITKEQEAENQRKLLEETLKAQKTKIDKLESSLNDTKAEQSKFVSKEDLPKQAFTTAQIISSNQKYVVAVACDTKEGISLGSGVIVGKASNNDFIILTNYHVIEGFYTSEKNPSCFITPYQGAIHYAKPVYFSNVATLTEMKV